MRTMQGTIGATVLALALTGCSSGGQPLPQAQPINSSSSSSSTSETTPVFHEPGAKDYTLSVKTLSKECFGSAGCLVTFRVVLSREAAAGSPDPGRTYDLTYEIRGGQEPMINTLSITGTQYSQPDDEMIETKSSKSKLTAVITEISEQ